MNQAISRALGDAMAVDQRVVTFGEDIAGAGGVFKTSEGLLERFGPRRVRDTPISEMGFVGAAVGAAATGLRPVVEVMFVEFIGVAFDQIVTEAAQIHYLSGGRLRVPMVVRASVGAGLGFGSQHSQTLERWFFGTAGMKLCVTSGPQSAYGLLRSAIADDNPVVVLEPRTLYGARERFDPQTTRIPLGKARTMATGRDVTILGLGQTVKFALEAARGAEGWTADVIDLATLMPWDADTVKESVAKTGRLVIAEENPLSGGWGATIAAAVSSELFGSLKAPVVRLTTPEVPVPHGKALEERYVPGPAYIRQSVTELLSTGRLPRHWWEE